MTNKQHNQRSDTSLTDVLLQTCCYAQYGVSEYLQHFCILLAGVSKYLQQYFVCQYDNVPTPSSDTLDVHPTPYPSSECLKTAVCQNYCKEVYLNICNGVSE